MNHNELDTSRELPGMKALEIRVTSDGFSLMKQSRQLNPVETVYSRHSISETMEHQVQYATSK
jgi:hypothetical protein